MANYFLYILSSRHHRHLSIGITRDLASGINNHRIMVSSRLKKRRVLQKLVYIETINSIDEAVSREIQLNRWPRREICKLVESVNPGWDSISISQLVYAGFDNG